MIRSSRFSELVFSLVLRFLSAIVFFVWCLDTSVAQDSVQTAVIAKGVKHFHYIKQGPYDIHVLAVDLREPSVRLETFRPLGLAKTSLQAKENSRPGHKVIAAINADFFSFKSCYPVNNHVKGGQFVVGTSNSRSHFGLDSGNRPFIEQFKFDGVFIDRHSHTWPLARVNEQYTGDSASLFTSYWVDSANALSNRTNYLVKLLGEQRRIGDTAKAVLRKKEYPPQGRVSSDYLILSVGNGNNSEQIASSLRLDDTLRFVLRLNPFLPNLSEVLGGAGRILLNGRKVTAENVDSEKVSADFVTKRHPRTFIGFNQDSTTLYLCTVDGRQTSSEGMNFDEMAEFLLSIGARNALNLDGGGSTTMVIRNRIVNSVSDKTGERPVANSLQVVQIGESKGE